MLFLGLLLYPPTGKSIKVFVQRVLAFTPSEIKEENRDKLSDYNWTLLDDKGERVDFNDYRGEVVLINFWATWCAPCVAELPSLHSLYAGYEDQMKFLFVSNEDRETTDKFLAAQGMSLPCFKPYTQVPSQLESSSIPATFLIDSKGKIAVRKIGAAKWDSDKFRKRLDRLLSDKG